MSNPLSIFAVLNENRYSIPLYQRNFAWTDVEISQLIIDVLDSIKENRPEYFIGTLVVSNKDNMYSIIDGQQRFTAILLIALAIQNEYILSKTYVKNINLNFSARRRSDETLNSLFKNDINKDKITGGELRRGYDETVCAIKEHIGSIDYSDISIEDFYEYLFHKVKIFISEMPDDLDVNLYFERFNSRGEQLEYHEVIKADLMQRLVTESVEYATIQKFGKIWDSCSEFDTPCIKFFKKKAKRSDPDEEREIVFKCEWSEYEPGKNSWRYGYSLKNIYSKIVVNEESKKSLISAIEEVEGSITANIDAAENEDSSKYRSIVNFNTFLYYVLYLTDNTGSDSIQLDDKKLKSAFRVSSRDSRWILRFGENLLKAKFIFDNLIIRNSLETTNRRKEGEWFLQKAYREDKNEKARRHLYVQTRFDKNSFPTNNHEILMLQSMFAVTFTAYKDTKWLYTTIKYLFENTENLNAAEFGDEFYRFLESLSKSFTKERICNSKGQVDAQRLRNDNSVPVYAFNLTDYVLWKNSGELKSEFTTINFDDFRFTYRRSIEHWYPQNPNEAEGKEKLPDDLLHCFGNLCLIVASQNSAFSNLYPLAKLANWRNIFRTQSLKLQMMAENTESWGSWDETKRTEILAMEKDILQLLNGYIKT